MVVVGRREQQLGRVGRAAGDDDEVCAKRSVSPPRSTTTSETWFPDPLVSSFTTLVFVSSVTFGCSSAGRTPSTSASDLAWTRHGKPSHVEHRTQWLYGMFASFSLIPQGAWNGR